MKRVVILLATSLMVSACATDGSVEPEQLRLGYGCSDIVVLGALVNTEAGPTDNIEGDLLGHGWFSAEIHVRRLLIGSGVPGRFQVRYFGHAQMREDREFILVAALADDRKAYVIRRASLASDRPRLEPRCSQTSALGRFAT